MENIKTEILKAINEGRLFDFIGNNYWQMSRDDLATIAGELAYALYDASRNMDKSEYESVIESLKNELSDRLED